MVVERVDITQGWVYDSTHYEYDADGFLIREQNLMNKKEYSAHKIENGNRIETTKSSLDYPQYIQTIKYYYDHDSLAPFQGGDRLTYQLKMKKYTNLLKQQVDSKNWDTMVWTTNYSYEYNAGKRLVGIHERASSSNGGLSISGTVMYWWCDWPE